MDAQSGRGEGAESGRQSGSAGLSPAVAGNAPADGTRRLIGALLSLVIGPGFGHIALGRWKRAVVWYSTLVVGLLFAPLSVWPLAVWFALRVAAAIDVARLRETGPVPPWWVVVVGWVGAVVVTVAVTTTARVLAGVGAGTGAKHQGHGRQHLVVVDGAGGRALGADRAEHSMTAPGARWRGRRRRGKQESP